MRFLYADTSALAKRFWQEAESEYVLEVFGTAEAIATVSLAYVELVSAAFRAARRGDVPASDVPNVLAHIKDDWSDFVRIAIDDQLIEQAAVLAERHVVRAYDSVHLAAALRWQNELGETVGFLAFDRELARAARAEGLEVFPDGDTF